MPRRQSGAFMVVGVVINHSALVRALTNRVS